MNKKTILILLPLLLLSSCEIDISFGSVTSNNTITTSPSVNNSINSFINTTPSISDSFETTSTSINTPLLSLTLSDNNFDSSNRYIADYDTGNYGDNDAGGFTFNYYRAYRQNAGTLMDLLPYVGSYGDGSLPGSFYNQTAIYDIRSIAITYYTAELGTTNPILKFGEDFHCLSSYTLEPSIKSNTLTYNFDGNVHFFRIESDSYRMTIQNIVIKYTNTITNIRYDKKAAYDDCVRINPVTYNSSLISGQSSVTIPTEIEQKDDSYEIVFSKTLTYYSYNDVVSNPSLADQAAVIEPEDVAAYFIAFGTYPANYVLKKNYNTAKNYFGANTRCVSQYDRTDGYATSVPYNYDSDFTYYECDINVSGTYSNNNRGVGRVVVWMSGFNGEGYDNSPVAVFTDDHYATFAEYFNYGSFGPRFDAEMSVVQASWSNAKTLIK